MDNSHDTTFSFYSAQAFKEHLYKEHSGQFDDDDLDNLTAACYQRLPRYSIITECPFCLPGQNSGIDLGNMVNHVTGHLIPLARISPAGHVAGDAESEYLASGKVSRGRPSQSGRRASLAERLQSEFPVEYQGENDTVEGYLLLNEAMPDADEEQCLAVWRMYRNH
jgi:hypothetical protein